MTPHPAPLSQEEPEEKIVRHAALLSSQLQSIRERMYPPRPENPAPVHDP